jgi:hypothetical protein
MTKLMSLRSARVSASSSFVWRAVRWLLLLEKPKPSPCIDVTLFTGPRLDTEILWESYRTARNESIAAQQSMQRVISWSMTVGTLTLAALGFLKSQGTSSSFSTLFGWAATCALGLLAGSQYLGEVGRMLRAGFYARQIERIIWVRIPQGVPKECSANLMWEGFLTQSERRLHKTYNPAILAALLAVSAIQFVPFFMFGVTSYLYFIPVVGFLATARLFLGIGKDYKERFPPKDSLESDPIAALLTLDTDGQLNLLAHLPEAEENDGR